jgi:tetratricopeptide (TPR) repeat protein
LTYQDFGHLALAIVHAGAYIGHMPHMSISKYRELFLAQRERMLEQYRKLPVKVDDYPKTVYTTWKMCYDLLDEGASRQMFWLIAFLHHDTIAEGIFRRAAINMQSYEPELPPTNVETTARAHVEDHLRQFLGTSGHWDPVLFSDAIGELASYSLIDFDRVNLAYTIHVLVQDWARTIILQPLDLALECTTTLLSLSIDCNDDAESHRFRTGLGLHVSKILSEHHGDIGANHAHRFAEVFRAREQWNQEETLRLQVKAAREHILGIDHPDTLKSVNSLAIVYKDQGRWNEAESLQVHILNAYKLIFGEADRKTSCIMNDLANTYQVQGRLEDAKSLQVQVWNTFKRVFGETHPDTLESINNLAVTYRSQGHLEQAESLQVQVWNTYSQILGEEHSSTLSSMYSLALTYSEEGRWEQAALLLTRILQVSNRVHGHQHPLTLSIKLSLQRVEVVKIRAAARECFYLINSKF